MGNGHAPGIAIGRGATGAAAGTAGSAGFAAGLAAADFLVSDFFFAAFPAGLRAGFFFAVFARLAALRAAIFFLAGFLAAAFFFFFGAFRAAFLALAMCTSVR
jgi:hypothetical protein